ncbi:MAG: ABC transporter permease [Cyanobacteria bacterium SZAS TMP-1]|nr:ABC transporter permease [Cyanobacteria bacterium SZAS TMP-1]
MSLPVYILKRILQALPLLFVISVLAFTMLMISPVDPLATMKANPSVSAAAIKAEEERLGLNKPAPERYAIWLSNTMQGNLGVSSTGGSIARRLFTCAGNTLLLNVFTFTFVWLIALPAGVYAAVHRGQFIDKMFGIITSTGMSMPTFLMCFLLLMFALATGVLPIGGMTSPNFDDMDQFHQMLDIGHHLIMPVCVLTFIQLAGIQRQVRSNLLDVLRADYVRTARAKGVDETKVIYKHALRNAVNPLITLLGFEFASLLSGAAITEMVLGYPGLGFLTLGAVLTKDINLVMASLMMGATMLILGNLLADVLLKVTDPRISIN